MTSQTAARTEPYPVIELDSLVRGKDGVTEREATGRVYLATVWGWVAAWGEPGRQYLFYPGRFEVIGKPRRVKDRGDIPARLRRDQ